jgi:hypothetical protein
VTFAAFARRTYPLPHSVITHVFHGKFKRLSLVSHIDKPRCYGVVWRDYEDGFVGVYWQDEDWTAAYKTNPETFYSLDYTVKKASVSTYTLVPKSTLVYRGHFRQT